MKTRLRLSDIGVIQRTPPSKFKTKPQNKIVLAARNLDSDDDSTIFILEVVAGTMFKEYYAWQVKIEDLDSFISFKDNKRLLPTKSRQIYRITAMDGKIHSVEKPTKEFTSKLILSDDNQDEGWECNDIEKISKFIENYKEQNGI